MENAKVGQVYVSGNTFNPEFCRVLAVTTEVPALEIKRWAVCGHTAVAGEVWIKHNSHRGRGVRWIPATVWGPTRYESHEAMIAAYAAQRAA
jgi:hypothetical protein